LHAPVIQLNDTDTVSDLYTINYAIHHFTSPEFIFTTLAKETLNSLLQEVEFIKIKNTYNDIISKIRDGINESYFDDLIDSETFDLNYFIIDVIRFRTTFEGDFDLFQHWIWSYNFQNTSLYDTYGMFNEDHLKTEMLRLFMIQKYLIFTSDNNDDVFWEGSKAFKFLKCPIPHLDAYWFLHFEKLDYITGLIFQNYSGEFIGIFEYIREKIESYGTIASSNNSLVNITKRIINNTLFEHYNMNNNKVAMINRDWSSGKFCKNNYPQKVLYAIDQIGTQYFFTNENTQEYFVLNSKVILSVIDYATKHKKKFIEELISLKK
jgi:hypothetical protein